ncbi:L-arginine ABC transporter membrane protein /L-ornithine ABC transporter membrane protein [Pseudomonas citronellolis]|jgi:arginine/ornithine transport system permease protein|uniref:Histidine/lysine/arginine/ornithine transport system permease protein HisM n=1 Tax=Pseudomonas citronellolis TaxID=53408 RepID=A0A127MP62_9PSED|nr:MULTISPECIES: ABC transporter permease [Pseudomonas]AMO75037.1 Octopine transport system permease protein OccM [Pseudomonas citronellolis]ANI13898.1 amino acid ABC transporter permease [Pseudomonas citronellolis]KES24874.1 amino acid ABC transporter permease [Pseudomonas sp. AAC]KRV68909.1 amino acid ABC transporter permease [Pseudomonas citronellolis]KRW80319.1 amino acid ABC transporter permease [Pseudomonas citronellolis]
MIFDYTVIWENLPLYFGGLLVTLKLLLISLAVGLLLAVPLALMRVSKRPAVNLPAWLYTYVIRGTPMLVQLFLIYYGLAQFEAVRNSVFWPWLSNASFCACLAFAINTSAYTAEILAGSLKATPHGEIEAAKAMGMSRLKMYRRILLPSALRRALPQYSNEVIMMLQTTSLASIVTLVDITGAARTVNSQYYLPFEAFITAGVFYLILTLILVRLFKAAERRWLAYLAPRKH